MAGLAQSVWAFVARCKGLYDKMKCVCMQKCDGAFLHFRLCAYVCMRVCVFAQLHTCMCLCLCECKQHTVLQDTLGSWWPPYGTNPTPRAIQNIDARGQNIGSSWRVLLLHLRRKPLFELKELEVHILYIVSRGGNMYIAGWPLLNCP